MGCVCEDSLQKLLSILDMQRKVVGIKFLFTKEDYNKCPVDQAKIPMNYCVMVKLATHGYSIKTNLEFCACSGGTRAIGLDQPSEKFKTGCEYFSFGLYKDLAIAKNEVNNMTFCNHKIYGVMIAPLEKYEEKPDVVIMVTNSYNAMRIIQAYTYEFGTQCNFKMTGNQAICSECTAYPFETNSMNISMLCAGTRYYAGWSDTELALGIPYGKFISLCDGVFETANGAERNEKKEQIYKRLAKTNLDGSNIILNQAYFIREK